MSVDKLNFKSENLTVDWIGFNIQGLVDIKQVKQIAEYLLLNFGFNSTFAIGPNGKQETLFFNSKNKYKVYFRVYKYSDIYWDGLKIDFSGNNAAQVYKFIQEQKLDWNIFQLPNLSLSRFDLCYFREIKSNYRKGQLKSFISNTIAKIDNKHKRNNFNYDRSTKGYILRIGNRKSSNFYRIYQTKKGLRFELEIKKNRVKQVTNLLFCYDIKQFEETLTKHFYTHSKKVLMFDNCYTDWLIKYFRKGNKPVGFLVTSYLEEINTNDFVTVFSLLQFLTFSRNQNYSQVQMYDQIYYLIEFNLKEYVEFSGVKSINQYQRNKFINLLNSFQKIEPLITYFTEEHFQSILAFPYVNIQKQGNSWVVKVAVSKLLYDYRYPFSFPNTFLTYENTYELKVKLEVIQTISQVPLEKIFYVEVFLDQFNVPTKKKRQIKQLIVEAFNQLQKEKLIQNKLNVVKKSGEIKQVNTLTSLLVGQANKIYFFESIQ